MIALPPAGFVMGLVVVRMQMQEQTQIMIVIHRNAEQVVVLLVEDVLPILTEGRLTAGSVKGVMILMYYAKTYLTEPILAASAAQLTA